VGANVPTFNSALIVGQSTVISGATRIQEYTSVAAMLTAGFSLTSPEVYAAQLYFGVTPQPSVLYVGRQDLTVPESALTAVQACRAANPNWWGVGVIGAAAADHEAIAAWAQAATPVCMYFYTTADAAVLANTTGNVAATLQAANDNRAFGVYATTQSGSAPLNAYEFAARMGVAMGLNTGLANSNFTMMFKVETGITPEPLTQAQVSLLQSLNINVYVSTANSYVWLQPGVLPNGQFFDEVLNLDMLSADLQLSMVNQLIALPSIPQNNAGEALLLNVAHQVCERAVTRGYIGPGTWNGQQVLALTAGTPLPKGYMIQAQDFALQGSGAKAARQAMPIYIAFNEAGAIQSISIGVNVQR
jgi:hypothetical protein